MIRSAIFFFLLGSNLIGRTVSIEDFLLSSEQDIRVAAQRDIIGSISSSDESTPFINNIQLRTRTNDFDITEQRYSMIFKFKGIGESSAQKAVQASYIDKHVYRGDLYFCDAVYERYKTVLRYIYLKRNRDSVTEIGKILNDRYNVLIGRVETTGFRISDLLDTKRQVIENERDLIRVNNNISELERRIIELSGSKSINFDEDDLISIEDISDFVSLINVDEEIHQNYYVKESLIRTQYSENLYNYEVGRNRRYFDFFEIGFDTGKWNKEYDRPFDNFRQSFYIELGFNLPFIKSDMHSLLRRRSGVIENRLDFMYLTENLKSEAANLSNDLHSLYRHRDMIMGHSIRELAESSYSDYINMEGTDPLIILDIKENKVRTRRMLEEIENSIRMAYCEILHLFGKHDLNLMVR